MAHASIFLRSAFRRPLNNSAGIISPNARNASHLLLPENADADCAAVVVSVSVEVPVPEIVPREHFGAGVAAGVIAQLRATIEGLSPPTGVIVIIDVADAPAATVTDGGDEVRLNPSGMAASATTSLKTGEVLTA